MKKLMIGLALAVAVSAPATANSWRSSDATYGTTMGYAPGGYAQGADSYAYVQAPGMAYGPPPVFNGGSYQGTDPDPFIREQLRREYPHEQGAE